MAVCHGGRFFHNSAFPWDEVVPITGSRAELLLNFKQAVVFAHPLGAAGRAGLDLSGVQRDGDVRDGGVLGFAAAVGKDGAVAVLVRKPDSLHGFGEGADLVGA